MRHLLTLVGFVLVGFTLPAQTSKIIGSIYDEQGKGLALTTVSLLKTKDSSLVKVSLSDQSGQYQFLNINDGNYFVAASSVGYSKKNSQAFEVNGTDISVPSVALKQVPNNMNNVTVTAKKPFIETRLDKTIVNVDASPTNAGSTAMDVLEKSPGIIVNNDGSISLLGKQGVIVMLDGKPTYLSASDLANLLKNMPASALDQIEIMTNPSAKYDATGNSGMINIKTKKGMNNGFNGSFMLGATTSIYKIDDKLYFMPKSQNSFNFNYRKYKFNFFGNYNPNFFRGRNVLEIDAKQINSQGELKGYTDQQTKFKFGNFNQTLKLGLDWYADSKNIFGVVASGFLFNGHPTPVTVNNVRNLDHSLRYQLVSEADNDISFNNFTGNLNWKHSFDTKGNELTADFDYVKYATVSDLLLVTDTYDGSLQYLNTSQLQGHLPGDIDIYSLKSDYTKPIKNGRVDAGFKSSYVRNDNEVEYHQSKGTGWIRDDIRSNHFIYDENINAAYINVNQQIKKWSFQGGMRVENTNSKGNQVTTKTEFSTNRTDFFPTAFVSYALDKKNQFTASYGRRIARPNYQDLNPFIFFLDTLTYRQGNIYLTPQYTHNVELKHAFKGKLITSLNYSETNDMISQIIVPVEGGDGTIKKLTPDNVASFRNIGISVTAPTKIAKWWNINLFTNVYNNHYVGVIDSTAIELQFTSFTANLTNTFTFSQGFTGEISGFYRHRTLDGLTKAEPVYQMTIGLSKQIIKGKGTLRLNIRDPFAWQKFEGYNQYANVDNHFLSRPDVRQVTATFSLRFGKQMQQQQRRIGSSQDEQNRVGAGSQ
jgi:iron complex outermembrane receptor protein